MEPRQALQLLTRGSRSDLLQTAAPVRPSGLQVLGPAGPGTRLARAVCFTLPRVRARLPPLVAGYKWPPKGGVQVLLVVMTGRGC